MGEARRRRQKGLPPRREAPAPTGNRRRAWRGRMIRLQVPMELQLAPGGEVYEVGRTGTRRVTSPAVLAALRSALERERQDNAQLEVMAARARAEREAAIELATTEEPEAEAVAAASADA